jgi:Flp pilus assembly pilin Flp
MGQLSYCPMSFTSTTLIMEEVNSLLQRFQSIAIREHGQALVEYSLLLALITVVAVALLTTMGTEVKTALQGVVDAI